MRFCIRLCFSFFFLFSTQIQVPQKIIGICQVSYHITAFLVVIRTTFKSWNKFLSGNQKLQIFSYFCKKKCRKIFKIFNFFFFSFFGHLLEIVFQLAFLAITVEYPKLFSRSNLTITPHRKKNGTNLTKKIVCTLTGFHSSIFDFVICLSFTLYVCAFVKNTIIKDFLIDEYPQNYKIGYRKIIIKQFHSVEESISCFLSQFFSLFHFHSLLFVDIFVQLFYGKEISINTEFWKMKY